MPLNGLFFSGSVVAVGFSFDAETLFVDAGKRCSCCRFHTFMLYYRIHWRVIVFPGWILLGQGGVIACVLPLPDCRVAPLLRSALAWWRQRGVSLGCLCERAPLRMVEDY